MVDCRHDCVEDTSAGDEAHHDDRVHLNGPEMPRKIFATTPQQFLNPAWLNSFVVASYCKHSSKSVLKKASKVDLTTTGSMSSSWVQV